MCILRVGLCCGYTVGYLRVGLYREYSVGILRVGLYCGYTMGTLRVGLYRGYFEGRPVLWVYCGYFEGRPILWVYSLRGTRVVSCGLIVTHAHIVTAVFPVFALPVGNILVHTCICGGK